MKNAFIHRSASVKVPILLVPLWKRSPSCFRVIQSRLLSSVSDTLACLMLWVWPIDFQYHYQAAAIGYSFVGCENGDGFHGWVTVQTFKSVSLNHDRTDNKKPSCR